MYLTYLDVMIAQGEESNWSEISALEIYSFNASSAIHFFNGANLKKCQKIVIRKLRAEFQKKKYQENTICC